MKRKIQPSFKAIEKKWQKAWEENQTYKTEQKFIRSTKSEKTKGKFYSLIEFPYPSGEGLHVGHVKGQTAVDVFARFKRMQGYNVLCPMGYDAFGLPAENFAIKSGKHPATFTEKNINNFIRQQKSFGPSFDWSRKIDTTDPEYYKWTQWIFLQLFKAGLAYEKEAPINWCPSCKTGLANEEVIDSKCERCDTPTEKKNMKQWFLKITAYAEKLIKDLDDVNWPEYIKTSQKNWIGKSEGVEIDFKIKNTDKKITVFTTRVDTIFGCTYCVIAPEHELINNLSSQIENLKEIEKYIIQTKNKSELQRTDLEKDKTGVEVKGIKAINPFNNKEIPIFVADYVLGNYGTGAVMAVPAHDERDFSFAKKYNIAIKESIIPLRIDKNNPPQKEKKTVERRTIHAIVYNPKNKKFLCLQWKNFSWVTFIVGGVEDNEDIVLAAKREVLEETGYKNLKFVKILGGQVCSKYFAAHKDQNRTAYTSAIYFELENEELEQINEEEKDKHSAVWLSLNEITKERMTCSELDIWLSRLNGENQIYTDDGILIDSEKYTGLNSAEAREKMVAWVEKEKLGNKQINYKLRDWLFSRQRYWGEPIPIIKCPHCGNVPLKEKDLPLLLPKVKNYKPTGTGESPLAQVEKWVNVKCPICGEKAKRETNTMPQWAGSSWYFLRYPDAHNKKEFASKEALKYFMPVDIYFGGAEHTTVHLLYSRFWMKALYDLGHVPVKEPFFRRVQHGLILGSDNRKMSKRWGNVINPTDVINDYGADVMRTYIMFMGPYGDYAAWSVSGIEGIKRFINKIWGLEEKVSNKVEADKKTISLLHQTIQKVTEDIERVSYHTAISQLMIMSNHLATQEKINKNVWENYLKLLAPFAPHISEELWQNLKSVSAGKQIKKSLNKLKSIHKESWPQYDKKFLEEDEIELVFQVNGKIRGKILAKANISQKEAEELAFKNQRIKESLEGKIPKKIIFVPKKLINIVI